MAHKFAKINARYKFEHLKIAKFNGCNINSMLKVYTCTCT